MPPTRSVRIGPEFAAIWPLAVLTVLGLFLVLQLLPLLIAPAAGSKGGPVPPTPGPEREKISG